MTLVISQDLSNFSEHGSSVEIEQRERRRFPVHHPAVLKIRREDREIEIVGITENVSEI
jgi:hypothetical protein